MKKTFIIKLIIIILLVAFVITTIVLYLKNEQFRNILDKYLFQKEIKENDVPFIEIDSSKISGMYAYDRYLCLLQGNKLELYNRYGKKEDSLEIEISNPLFESNENYLAIAEKNGSKLYFINGNNIVWQKDIEGNISNINVNRNGYLSITILGTSYKTVIKSFNSSGEELFTTYLASTNVVDTDISNDNKYLAIAETNISGIVVQSAIKIISIDDAKDNTANSIKYTHLANSGDLIINIKYQNKNNLICMYDEHIDILNNDQNNEIVNLKEKELLFADINFPTKVIKVSQIMTGLFNSKAEMEIIDSNNNSSNKIELENVPKAIKIQDNIVAINLGTNALFIRENGWVARKYESLHEIHDILICRNIAGIVTKNKIEIISL